MKRSRYTEEQIAYALRQVDGGTPAIEVCRKMGISEQTFYTWRGSVRAIFASHRSRRRQRISAGAWTSWPTAWTTDRSFAS